MAIRGTTGYMVSWIHPSLHPMTPNGTSITSAVFARLMVWPTHTNMVWPRCNGNNRPLHLCTACVRCDLIILEILQTSRPIPLVWDVRATVDSMVCCQTEVDARCGKLNLWCVCVCMCMCVWCVLSLVSLEYNSTHWSTLPDLLIQGYCGRCTGVHRSYKTDTAASSLSPLLL